MALDQSQVKHASSFKEQFTARAIVIGGIIGAVVSVGVMLILVKADRKSVG